MVKSDIGENIFERSKKELENCKFSLTREGKMWYNIRLDRSLGSDGISAEFLEY